MGIEMRKIIATALMLMSTAVFAGHHAENEMSANVAIAKSGYDAFASGDMEAWKSTQADDVVWTVQVGLPYAGTYTGAEAVIEGVFSPIGEMWPNFKVEPIHYYESGDTVFVHIKMTAKGLDTESIHMVTIKNGKYASFQPFEDSAAMMKVAK
jgi:hypothetical protein